MKIGALAVLAAFALALPCAAFPSEHDDIEAIKSLLRQYVATQDAGDLMAQSKLMTADRVAINQSGSRRTDNVENMKYQQASADAQKKRVPGLQNITMDQDLLIKLYGDGKVAIASFFRTVERFYTPGTSKELMDEYGSGGSETGTLVLEKQKDGIWKIVHSHYSGPIS